MNIGRENKAERRHKEVLKDSSSKYRPPRYENSFYTPEQKKRREEEKSKRQFERLQRRAIERFGRMGTDD